jgi:hypothetical protein
VAPLLVLSDAILNNTEPDLVGLSDEVGIMLGEALTYARGEYTDCGGKEAESAELDE